MNQLKEFKVPESKEYRLEDIQNVNHKPHPYCITPKHLTGESMYLGEKEIRDAEKNHGARCGIYVSPDGKQYKNAFKSGWKKCNLSYDEHTSDRVLFIKALVDKEVKDLENIQDYLKSIAPKMKELKIDGVAFIGPDKKPHEEKSKTK
jgi:hypothetical protein